VMGPSCGLALADLGADVIKIEPAAEGSKPAGDNTRRLRGAGAGFFAMLNRNKRSLVLDLKQEQGRQAARALAAEADVLIENFRPGALDRQGLGYEALRQVNPRLVYCSLKGFLPGPYEHRVALDEVVQMMGGLAYMTGPEGRPLRAGASVNDIMGGMFGAIGAMAALAQRERTGQGQEVQSALFENNVFLVAQHMMQYAVTGKAPSPMPSRIAAWGVYDVFTVAGGEQVFLAVVSDTQWAIFCDAFGFDDLKNDPRLDSNNKRVMERAWMMPLLRERLGTRRAAEISAIFEARGLPFAPIARPEDLFDDPHLNETGGLAPMHLPDGRDTKVPLMPIALDGVRPGVRNDPPRLGEHTRGLLRELGYADADIDALCSREVVAG